MPRPRKCRRVCSLPPVGEFCPVASGCTDKSGSAGSVVLTIDEYESIRLIDREGLSQEKSAVQMQVSRATVQQIYNSARVKIAEALVCGLGIKISGGDYTLCGENEAFCESGRCEDCHRRNNLCCESYRIRCKRRGATDKE